LADAVEAILGAVYLDGGLEAARQVVERIVLAPAEDEPEIEEFRNYKALLQEKAQASGYPQPVYVTVATDGPEHEKTFFVEARIAPGWEAQGSGSTKKAASQMAARILYERLVEVLEQEGQSQEGQSQEGQSQEGQGGSGARDLGRTA
jgi:ribonuclease-3